MKVVLGWDIHFQDLGVLLTVAVYVFRGGLLSAIFNEVLLQFVLIWLGALLIPILGLMVAGGWNGMEWCTWWGLLILGIGLVYCWHFQPRKTK